tara:strand:+ start:834 stop:1697 length:864 start_codon:yes stop_codon:yes gene_type:complete
MTENATEQAPVTENTGVEEQTEGQIATEAVESTEDAPILNLEKDLKLDITELGNLLEENKGLGKFVEEDKFNINKALKSLTNAEKLIGKRIEEADPEALEGILNKFGVPKSADEYEIEAAETEMELVGKYKEMAKEAGLTKEAAKKFYQKFVELNAPETKVNEEKVLIEKDLTELKETFGENLEDVKKTANKALEHFGGEDLTDLITKKGLGTNKAFIKFLSDIGSKFKDVDLKPADPASYVPTSNEVREKIQNIRQSEEYKRALDNPYGNEYKKLSASLTELYQKL